jgi:AraC-like DNA-binding protein
MAMRVERGPDVATQRRIDEWPAIVLPLGTSVVTVEMGETKERVDRTSLAIVPAKQRYRLRASSPLTSVVTLLVGPLARAAACREYRGHIDAARFDELLGLRRVLSRTRWVDEIVQRYLFEREECEKHRSRAAVFLETEIAKEIYFLSKERDERQTRASVASEEGDIVSRARAFIDEDLSRLQSVRSLAERCHASESTLLRAFQRELGATPGTYARERRLDSALLFLQAGRHSVSEVATRVGYASLAAFTTAFSRHFGAPPSSVRKERGSLAILPPQGAGSRRK